MRPWFNSGRAEHACPLPGGVVEAGIGPSLNILPCIEHFRISKLDADAGKPPLPGLSRLHTPCVVGAETYRAAVRPLDLNFREKSCASQHVGESPLAVMVHQRR